MYEKLKRLFSNPPPLERRIICGYCEKSRVPDYVDFNGVCWVCKNCQKLLRAGKEIG